MAIKMIEKINGLFSKRECLNRTTKNKYLLKDGTGKIRYILPENKKMAICVIIDQPFY